MGLSCWISLVMILVCSSRRTISYGSNNRVGINFLEKVIESDLVRFEKLSFQNSLRTTGFWKMTAPFPEILGSLKIAENLPTYVFSHSHCLVLRERPTITTKTRRSSTWDFELKLKPSVRDCELNFELATCGIDAATMYTRDIAQLGL